MAYKVDNAIIMAAGLSSRFVPLSYEKPKALISIHGEILIERQIRQLKEAGISDIYIVTGYKAEQFKYLENKFQVKLVHNPYYSERNNHYSLYLVKDFLKNSYICSADNYFIENPFEAVVEDAYYASVYAPGNTNEWCLKLNEKDEIQEVSVGGHDSWIMMGHVFFTESFSKKFIEILSACIDDEQTKSKLWESIYIEHLNELTMKARKYPSDLIFEFDSLDELRLFDPSYLTCSNSKIMRQIASVLKAEESEITQIIPLKDTFGNTSGMQFLCKGNRYAYHYENENLEML